MAPVEAQSPTPRRRIGYAARRELIVDSAMQVFAEAGYHAASLDEISRRAGITKAVLYDHFPSKAKLHLHLLRTERDRLLAHVTERLDAAGTGSEGVAGALDAFYGWVESHPYAWRMLFRETTGDPKVAAAHRRIQAQAHETVIEILLAGGAAAFAPGLGPERARAALGALIGGATHGLAHWWFDNRTVPREHLVELTMDVLWHGLERTRRREAAWDTEG